MSCEVAQKQAPCDVTETDRRRGQEDSDVTEEDEDSLRRAALARCRQASSWCSRTVYPAGSEPLQLHWLRLTRGRGGEGGERHQAALAELDKRRISPSVATNTWILKSPFYSSHDNSRGHGDLRL